MSAGLGFMEGVRNDGQGYRVKHGGAQTLNGTKSNQAANAGRQAAQHRSSCEEREPKLEDSPAPETIGNGTREHEQAGDHKGIRVEDPLQSRQRGMKFVLNGRQRNINNGYIHANQQQTHAADA